MGASDIPVQTQTCGATSPDGYFTCTRPKGHAGEHVGVAGVNPRVVGHWEDKPEVTAVDAHYTEDPLTQREWRVLSIVKDLQDERYQSTALSQEDLGDLFDLHVKGYVGVSLGKVVLTDLGRDALEVPHG